MSQMREGDSTSTRAILVEDSSEYVGCWSFMKPVKLRSVERWYNDKTFILGNLVEQFALCEEFVLTVD